MIFFHLFLCSSSKSESENVSTGGHQTVRPESSSSIEQLDSPDRELLQMGTSIESTSPAPTSAAYSAANQTSWGDYDPTQAWDNEPSVPTAATTTVSNAYNGINEDGQQQQQQTANDDRMDNDSYQQHNTQENFYDDFNQQQQQDQPMADGFALIGKQCFVLYSYTAQNDDELTIIEQEILNVVNAADKDWVQAQNKDG